MASPHTSHLHQNPKPGDVTLAEQAVTRILMAAAAIRGQDRAYLPIRALPLQI